MASNAILISLPSLFICLLLGHVPISLVRSAIGKCSGCRFDNRGTALFLIYVLTLNPSKELKNMIMYLIHVSFNVVLIDVRYHLLFKNTAQHLNGDAFF